MMARIQQVTLFAQILAAALLAAACAAFFHGALAIAFTVACAIMLVASIHPAIICFDFAMSRHAKSPAPLEFRLTALQMLATIDREVDASMRGFCWAQPFRSHVPAPAPLGAPRRLPILFVHGYCCNRAIWHPFMAHAARAGYVCDAVTLEPPFSSIEAYASQIDGALDALLVRTGAAQAILIGHSMGGLACRAWSKEYGHDRLAHLLTLGTPHAGTFLAKFLRGTNVTQMREGSPWLGALAQHEPPELRPKTTSIYSFHDNIVAPQLSSHLEGARNIALGGLGHLSLLYSQEVWELCLEAVDPLSPRDEQMPRAEIAVDGPVAAPEPTPQTATVDPSE